MPKYINADKLCEDLMNRWEIADKEKEKEIQSIMADVVVPIVVGQPSADVIEVVRCKDCSHYIEPYCVRFITAMIPMSENDYCSKGKRRESK